MVDSRYLLWLTYVPLPPSVSLLRNRPFLIRITYIHSSLSCSFSSDSSGKILDPLVSPYVDTALPLLWVTLMKSGGGLANPYSIRQIMYVVPPKAVRRFRLS